MNRLRKEAWRVFLALAGPPPWVCARCGEPITKIGLHADEGHVHHVDQDIANNVPENLEIIHPGCHVRHHKQGRPFSVEHREALSQSLKGRTGGMSGKRHSEATRRKISESMRGNRNRRN